MIRLGLPGQRLQWLLAASLALNLFLVALIAAHLLRRPGHERWARPAMVIERLAASLPRADGDKLRAALAARNTEVGVLVDAFRAAQDEVRAALRSQPFDEAALARAMADAETAHAALEKAIHGLMANAAGQMSPEGRAGLANWPRPKASKP